MITWHDTVSMKPGEIVVPGGLKHLFDDPDVKELAASLKQTGGEPAQAIACEWKTKRIIFGRHRLAACLKAKTKRISVRFVEGTAAELENIADIENLCRHNPDRETIRRAYEDRLKAIAGQSSKNEAPEPRKPGRPKTPERQAREEVAAKLGVSERTVRREVAPAAPPPPKPAVDGKNGCPKEVDENARAVQQALDDIDSMSKRAQRILSEQAALMAPPTVQRIKEIAQQLGAVAREARPAAVCPRFNGLGHLSGNPSCCGGRGWVTADAAKALEAGKKQAVLPIEPVDEPPDLDYEPDPDPFNGMDADLDGGDVL